MEEGFRITRMIWNAADDHFHPAEVTYEKPDGSSETMPADQLPFAVEGDVTVEGEGVVVRAGRCTNCGQVVLSAVA